MILETSDPAASAEPGAVILFPTSKAIYITKKGLARPALNLKMSSLVHLLSAFS